MLSDAASRNESQPVNRVSLFVVNDVISRWYVSGITKIRLKICGVMMLLLMNQSPSGITSQLLQLHIYVCLEIYDASDFGCSSTERLFSLYAEQFAAPTTTGD